MLGRRQRQGAGVRPLAVAIGRKTRQPRQHFYLALYWAEALAAQDQELELRALFVPVAAQLAQAEARILAELNGAQGSAVDIGGYYHPDPALCAAVMRPSATLNAIIDAIG